jgi:hypothetical protein
MSAKNPDKQTLCDECLAALGNGRAIEKVKLRPGGDFARRSTAFFEGLQELLREHHLETITVKMNDGEREFNFERDTKRAIPVVTYYALMDRKSVMGQQTLEFTAQAYHQLGKQLDAIRKDKFGKGVHPNNEEEMAYRFIGLHCEVVAMKLDAVIEHMGEIERPRTTGGRDRNGGERPRESRSNEYGRGRDDRSGGSGGRGRTPGR